MYPGITKWEVINAVTTGIGVSRQYDSEEPSLDTRKYLSFTATDIYNAYNPEILFPIDITGYDRILRVYGEGSAPISPLSTESISVSVDTARLVLRSGSGVIGISTRDFDTTLLNKYLKIENANIGQQDMTFLVSTG